MKDVNVCPKGMVSAGNICEPAVKPFNQEDLENLYHETHAFFNIELSKTELKSLGKKLYDVEKDYQKKNLRFTDLDWMAITRNFIKKR